MMRPFLIAGAAVLATVGVAHAQAAPDYVKMAGASDKFEITEAKLAEVRSHNPKVKKFARMMVRDHTDSTMKIKAAARQVMGHNPPPPMLNDEQSDNLAKLKATHGRDFDRTYIDQQVTSHQQALDLTQGYASNGDAPPLKHAAEGIAPVVQQHLDMAKQLQGMMQ